MSEVPTTRRRYLDHKLNGFGSATRKSGNWLDFQAGLWTTDFSDKYRSKYYGVQETTSEGHPFRKNKNLVWDVGGPFTTAKHTQEVPDPIWNSLKSVVRSGNSSGTYTVFNGNLLAINPDLVNYPSKQDSSDAVLNAKGATAVARCSPVNPVANLATGLGELAKDGIPSIPGIRTWEVKALAAKNAGHEFLNIVFGWTPLINDIKATAKAVRLAQTVLRQYERDAGKVVRRNYAFDIEETSTGPVTLSTNGGPYSGVIDGGAFDGQSRNLSDILGAGKLEKRSKTVRRIWFSGAFTYHLPTGYNSRKALDRATAEANRVFGLDLTPEVLWNLAPWSWALDWVANAGDVIKNVSQHTQYGLIMRYGYIMENTISMDTYTWTQTTPGVNQTTVPLAAPVHAITNVKKRRGANPFGFGLTWDGLSTTQKAIAAALGLTHSRS